MPITSSEVRHGFVFSDESGARADRLATDAMPPLTRRRDFRYHWAALAAIAILLGWWVSAQRAPVTTTGVARVTAPPCALPDACLQMEFQASSLPDPSRVRKVELLTGTGSVRIHIAGALPPEQAAELAGPGMVVLVAKVGRLPGDDGLMTVSAVVDWTPLIRAFRR